MHESKDRPGITEVVVVLAICVGMLMGLATVDDRAARREAARAGAVLADRAKVSAERAAREAMTAPVARTERPGRESKPIVVPAGPSGAGTSVVTHARKPATPSRDDAGPILLLLMGGAGLSMAGAGLRLLSRRSA